MQKPDRYSQFRINGKSRGMEVIVQENTQEVARRAADMVCLAIDRKPDLVLGLATGSTPVALYEELVRRCAKGRVSFKTVTTFNLDEYVGLAPDHPQSYRRFMDEHFFNHIDIDPAHTHLPRGDAANPVEAAAEYDRMIEEAGGIDLQILGLGGNGHIGFNEPTSSLSSHTRIKTLTRSTMRDNARFFDPGEFKPFNALTMGIGSIMEARRILMLATGERKAEAVAAMIEGPITSMHPASILQMHDNAVVIVDEEAAGRLQMRDYYDWVLTMQDKLADRYGDPR